MLVSIACWSLHLSIMALQRTAEENPLFFHASVARSRLSLSVGPQKSLSRSGHPRPKVARAWRDPPGRLTA